MALQFQASLATPSCVCSPPSASSWSPKNSILCFIGDHRSSRVLRSVIGEHKMREKNIFSVKKGMCVSVRSSLETAGLVVGQVTEVNKDTFWPIVNTAGDKTVVLDMYTQWCGPCKVMAPKFQELSEKYVDVVFLKLDCNQDNKPLAKELGISVVPTFKILKDSKIVKEVTGAKFDDLVVAIESIRSIHYHSSQPPTDGTLLSSSTTTGPPLLSSTTMPISLHDQRMVHKIRFFDITFFIEHEHHGLPIPQQV
ncbi:hypothetical protein F0562_025541 [Nyssa sinensis]|uniref:Thioredoxin domain-containing protein n=1 Tax=Nyssa sinensis TaxID=561372 RepID=A0A5J5B844_9ASTE|nr:hypothetical protein F0562_025541 [Nyssa sinensis]